MKAQVTLTSSESKRLIAKALLQHEKLKLALSSGITVINLGSTNAFLAEEILKKGIEKERFVAGMIDAKGTCVVPRNERMSAIVLRKGRVVEEDAEGIVAEMGASDMFVKGANAVDSEGRAWVMLASETGGTVGRTLGTLLARGVPILVPVGLEKFVPMSLEKASALTGIHRVELSTGVPVGLMPVPGEIVSEIEAFRLLGEVDVHVIGAGGIGGGEGSHTFLIDGEAGEVEKIFNLVKGIKGESRIKAIRGSCLNCPYHCPERMEKA